MDKDAPRSPGKMSRYLGFGEDLTADIEASMLTTLTLRPTPPRFYDNLVWKAAEVRESYQDEIIRSFGHSGIPLADVRINDVLPRIHVLRPERIFKQLRFEDINHFPRNPEKVITPLLIEKSVTWRHAQFAHHLIVDRLPHLRTTEMNQTEYVWRRLGSLFREYISRLRNQHFTLMKEGDRQNEITAALFAAFERILFLQFQAAAMKPEYLEAVVHRPPHLGHAAILEIEPGLDARFDRDPSNVRKTRYHALLEHLHQRIAHHITSRVTARTRS